MTQRGTVRVLCQGGGFKDMYLGKVGERRRGVLLGLEKMSNKKKM